MDCRIYAAESDSDFAKAKTIILAYADFLNTDLSFQGFDNEMKTLAVMYGSSSKGCMLLAELSGNIVGTVGLRFLSEGIAEMKRMFVLPEYQGQGIGNTLMLSFIDKARELAYKSIKLDTIPELDRAIELYKKHQFTLTEPYCYNPHPKVQFYELRLS